MIGIIMIGVIIIIMVLRFYLTSDLEQLKKSDLYHYKHIVRNENSETVYRRVLL